MKKFKGVLCKRVKLEHKITDEEAETVERLIKEGYVVIYDKKGDYS